MDGRLSGAQALNTQVKILPKLAAGPAPRAVVGLFAQGPRFVGLNTEEYRLTDQVRYGRILGRGPLELLKGLANSDASTDEKLIDRIVREYDAERAQLLYITERIRKIPMDADAHEDAWQPTVAKIKQQQPPGAENFAPDRLIAMHLPILFRVGVSGFEHISHSGDVTLCLAPREFSCLRYLGKPISVADLNAAIAAGEEKLTSDEVLALLEQLVDSRLLQSFKADDPDLETKYDEDIKRQRQQERVSSALFSAIERAEQRQPRQPGKIPVLPINFDWAIAPLALGFLFSSARIHKDGCLNDSFDFRPNWLTDFNAPVIAGPAVLLYSHYIWTSSAMLSWSAKAKKDNPLAINVHGGPDVPKYEPDVERYFADHPSVDIAVHGEGEITACEILEVLADALLTGDPVDLSLLDTVPGLSYRGADGFAVRTADRDRISELEDIPSPYLTGEFQVWADAKVPNIVLETNRGCPYGCTFCDWGSATASKVRKFDMERVYGELEWCASNGITDIAFADANFGMYERDIDIARRAAELKTQYGFPRDLGTNYAKNSVKHLKPIVDILVQADILAKGLLSLQSMDQDTLSVINRANIKLEKYESLAAEFRANDLPLYVDLMMGLPGSTVESFRNDLQECVDREVYPKVHPTQLLVNSPMNEAAYRKKNGIVAAPGEFVTSCASFTEEDYEEMGKVRRIFLLAEKFGILRHALRYARHETGRREIDLLSQLMVAADEGGEYWPALRFTLLFTPHIMVPPVDWGWFLRDLHRFFVEQLGIADDDALDSALRAQHAVLPAAERQFPAITEMPCDYAAWHADVLTAKENGHLADWHDTVAPLRSYGPGSVTITDPGLVCSNALGRNFNDGVWSIWELSSEISRPSEGVVTTGH